MGLVGNVWAEIGGDASDLKRAAQESVDSLQQIKSAAQNLGLGNVSDDFARLNKDLLTGFSQTQNSADSTTTSVNSLALSFTGLNQAVHLAKQALNGLEEAWGFLEEGSRLVSLEQASYRLAQSYDANMISIVSSIRSASFNTINEYDAMKAANLALTMGISTNADEIANLMEIAIERGRAFGLTTEDAFDRITRGIGRRSTRILDDLGFTANATEANRVYAESLGISTTALTEDMKVRALFNQILKEGNAELEKQGGLTQDISTPYQRIATSLKTLFNEAKIGAAYIFGQAISSPAETIKYEEQLSSQLVKKGAGYSAYFLSQWRSAIAENEQMIKSITYLSKEQYTEAQRWYGMAEMQAEAMSKFGDSALNMEIQFNDSQQTVSDSIETFGDFNSMLEQAWEKSNILSDAINAIPSYKLIVIEVEQRIRSMAAEAARWYGQYYNYLNEKNTGGMHGGSFVGLQHGGIVPPGFSNDGMPIWVSSGERVDVTPAGNKTVSGEGATVNRFYAPVTLQIDKTTAKDIMRELRL